jgi:HSP20 family protein
MIRFDLIPQMAAMVEKRACLAMPNVDISENEDGYRLSFEIPGTMKDDVKIWVENDLLTVSGEKKNNLGKEDVKVHSERSYGKFERSFRLPKNANKEEVKAEFIDGVLEVVIPKTEEAKPKEINIEVK